MIPITIVTGFLGSGKTTLIGRLLRDPAFAQTAVIVNEFGEIGLDHELIATSDETLVALTTGCLCCCVRSDLVATVLELHRRRDLGEISAYERVLIETSGLADPAPILQGLMADRDVGQNHTIGTVLTLVDAVHGAATLARHVEARRQVALADRILVTKCDLVGMREPLKETIVALNPSVEVMSAVKGAIAPAMLFGEAGARGGSAEAGFLSAVHSGGIESFTWEREYPVPALALALWLESLAEHCGAKLLRLKGLVEVEEMPGRPAVIHVVQHTISEPEWLDCWPSEDRDSRVVFICEAVPRHFPARLLAAIEEEVREEMARGRVV
jgi:G3E family GTPase